MPLTIPQKEISESEKRFRVLAAGRRFGKTYLLTYLLMKFSAPVGSLVWYIAPTSQQAREVVWDELKTKLKAHRWVYGDKAFNETYMRANLINGSKIFLKSANKPEALRGNGLDFACFDETSDISEDTWLSIISPMLTNKRGHAMFTGSPKGRDWFYELYLKGQNEKEKDWQSWQYTTLQGGNVPEEEIQNARDMLDERTFRREYEASFETYEGLVYYNFGRGNIQPLSHNNIKITDKTELHIGMDFNVKPITASIGTISNGILHIFDEVSIYESNTYELCEEIRNRYPRNRINVYPDPACTHNRTSSYGNTDLSILQTPLYNLNPYYRSKHPLIKDRVNSVNALLLNTNKKKRLYVTHNCKNIIKGLSKQTFKPGTNVPDKTKGYDHFNDGLGYMIEYLFPIERRPVGYVAPMG